MATLADVYAQARALLGDHQGDVWANSVLFPFTRMTYREALRILRAEKMQIFRKEVVLSNVPINTVLLNTSSTPVLPTDLLRPLELHEKQYGSSAKYVQMRNDKGILTDQTARTNREIWSWRENGIHLNAVTPTATNIKLQYEADLFNMTAYAPSNVSGATNAGPIVITSAGHGLTGGDVVYIADVGGNAAANGWWTITWIGATSFSLNGSVGSGIWTSGGTVTSYKTSGTTLAVPDIEDAVSLLTASYAARSLEQTALQEFYEKKAQEVLGQIGACEKAVEASVAGKFGAR